MTYVPLYLSELSNYLKQNDIKFLEFKKIVLTGATGMILSFFIDVLLFETNFSIKVIALVRNIEAAKLRFSKYNLDKRLIFQSYNFNDLINVFNALMVYNVLLSFLRCNRIVLAIGEADMLPVSIL